MAVQDLTADMLTRIRNAVRNREKHVICLDNKLNRGVAVAMAYGPEAGLAIVDRLAGEPALARYHLLPSVRADLLAKVGRYEEAQAEAARAAELTQNTRERSLLLDRVAAWARASATPPS